VVLATVKVFLNLTLSMPYDHQQVRRPYPQAAGLFCDRQQQHAV